MDKRSWCAECQEWVGPGHEHSSLKLSLEQRSAVFQAAVDRINRYGDHPRNVDPEELSEVLEAGTQGLDSDIMQAAYKYIDRNELNIIKTAKKIHHVQHEIMSDSILTLASKTNGHIGVGEGKIKGGRRIYDIEDFGYDQDEDLEIR